MESATAFDYEKNLLECAAGKRPALIALYEQEASRLLTVAVRILQNQGLAEDVVHDAFVKVWTHAKTYDPSLGSARGWIYTLTRNLALNAVKYSNRQLQSDPEFLLDLIDSREAEAQGAEDEISQMVQDGVSQSHLMACLEELKPEPKLCILHAYVDGYTQDEIANLIQKPLGTVKSWIKRSLAALKECLQ